MNIYIYTYIYIYDIYIYNMYYCITPKMPQSVPQQPCNRFRSLFTGSDDSTVGDDITFLGIHNLGCCWIMIIR